MCYVTRATVFTPCEARKKTDDFWPPNKSIAVKQHRGEQVRLATGGKKYRNNKGLEDHGGL